MIGFILHDEQANTAMNRFCNVVMTLSAVAVVFSTVLVTMRGQGRSTGPNPHAMILHKVYLDAYECKGSNYFSYTSPFGCYNPNSYDGSQTYDVYDELLSWDRTGQPKQFRRTYYYSTDGSCQNQIEGVSMESWLGGKMCSTTSGDNYAVSEQESLTYSKS